MVREAESHAEEDRKRREEVETRNQAEQLTYQAERTLADLGDKVAAEDRAAVEEKVATLRNALKTEPIEVVRTASTELADLLTKVGTAAYQAASAAAGETASGDGDGHGPSDGSGPAGGEGSAEGEETVEGEFKEV